MRKIANHLLLNMNEDSIYCGNHRVYYVCRAATVRMKCVHSLFPHVHCNLAYKVWQQCIFQSAFKGTLMRIERTSSCGHNVENPPPLNSRE